MTIRSAYIVTLFLAAFSVFVGVSPVCAASPHITGFQAPKTEILITKKSAICSAVCFKLREKCYATERAAVKGMYGHDGPMYEYKLGRVADYCLCRHEQCVKSTYCNNQEPPQCRLIN